MQPPNFTLLPFNIATPDLDLRTLPEKSCHTCSFRVSSLRPEELTPAEVSMHLLQKAYVSCKKYNYICHSPDHLTYFTKCDDYWGKEEQESAEKTRRHQAVVQKYKVYHPKLEEIDGDALNVCLWAVIIMVIVSSVSFYRLIEAAIDNTPIIPKGILFLLWGFLIIGVPLIFSVIWKVRTIKRCIQNPQ